MAEGQPKTEPPVWYRQLSPEEFTTLLRDRGPGSHKSHKEYFEWVAELVERTRAYIEEEERLKKNPPKMVGPGKFAMNTSRPTQLPELTIPDSNTKFLKLAVEGDALTAPVNVNPPLPEQMVEEYRSDPAAMRISEEGLADSGF